MLIRGPFPLLGLPLMDTRPPNPRRVACFMFPQVMALDVTGPMQVFASANEVASRQGLPPLYRLETVGPQAGAVETSSGLRLVADSGIAEWDPRGVDTLLIAGGNGVDAIRQDPDCLGWLRRVEPQVRRLGSVCSGALLLAEAGLLHGRAVTTHWCRERDIGRYDGLRLEIDRLHTYDASGKAGDPHVFTSAGVTAGIDLALALLEADAGPAMALAVARYLVLFLRRPGDQAQFSAHLGPPGTRSSSADDRILTLLDWLPEHLAESLTLDRLAERCGMTERTFIRRFQQATGQPPGRYVESLRLEAARGLLHTGSIPVAEVARRCGYDHPEALRRAFQKTLKLSPADYARRFGGPSGSAGVPTPLF